VADSVAFLKDTLAHLLNQRKNAGNTARTPADGRTGLNNEIAADSSLLAYYTGIKFPEYQRMKSLENRCAYIRSRRSEHSLAYGPLQRGGIETIVGWLITALAITLGAPFWFDLLGKLISIRGAGKKISLDSNNDDLAPAASPASSAPAPSTNVNVNTNSGEEAVG
jgi:hypothetical protein